VVHRAKVRSTVLRRLLFYVLRITYTSMSGATPFAHVLTLKTLILSLAALLPTAYFQPPPSTWSSTSRLTLFDQPTLLDSWEDEERWALFVASEMSPRCDCVHVWV
jgi:hypothetical protein